MSAFDLLSYASSTDHIDGTGVVAEAEEAFRRLTGSDFALCMANATTALAAAEDALGFTRGDTVVTSPLGAPETISHLLHLGCTVVFADVEPASLTLDPVAAEDCLTAQTRGIVAADVAGYPHDTLTIRELANRHRLVYLADCAQGFLARRDGRHSGAAADIAVLSCNAQKQLKAGEMGVLLTNESLYLAVVSDSQHAHRQLRDTGAINHFPRRNGRVNPLAVEAALAALPKAIERVEWQRRRAARLIAALNASGLVEPIAFNSWVQPTYPSVIVRWSGRLQPTALLAHLQAANLPARLRDLPVRALHQLPGLFERFPGQLEIPFPLVQAEEAVQRCVCVEAAW